MKAHTKETQMSISPEKAVHLLKEGNNRFIENKTISRDLLDQVKDTSIGQFPFATILSCIDSRVSSELIFDQGIGDIFSARVAGNFVVLVLGHTACGAVKGACDNAKLGNLSALLSKIKPAVEAVTNPIDTSLRNSSNIDFVNTVAEKNVHMTIDNIRAQSPVLKEMEDEGAIKIVGAMYDIKDGSVTFYE